MSKKEISKELLKEVEGLETLDLEQDLEGKETQQEKKVEVTIPKVNLVDSSKLSKKDKNTIAVYPYLNAEGALQYEVLRRKGLGQKFLVRSYDKNGKEVYGLQEDKKLVPYNLPKVLEAIKEEKIIWITEGESKADTLNKLGFTCTTCAFTGAEKWSDYYSNFLKGATRIIVLGDNDKNGEEFVYNTATSLSETLDNVKVWPLMLTEIYSNLKLGGDIDDLIEVLGVDTVKNTLESIETNFEVED